MAIDANNIIAGTLTIGDRPPKEVTSVTEISDSGIRIVRIEYGCGSSTQNFPRSDSHRWRISRQGCSRTFADRLIGSRIGHRRLIASDYDRIADYSTGAVRDGPAKRVISVTETVDLGGWTIRAHNRTRAADNRPRSGALGRRIPGQRRTAVFTESLIGSRIRWNKSTSGVTKYSKLPTVNRLVVKRLPKGSYPGGAAIYGSRC